MGYMGYMGPVRGTYGFSLPHGLTPPQGGGRLNPTQPVREAPLTGCRNCPPPPCGGGTIPTPREGRSVPVREATLLR